MMLDKFPIIVVATITKQQKKVAAPISKCALLHSQTKNKLKIMQTPFIQTLISSNHVPALALDAFNASHIVGNHRTF